MSSDAEFDAFLAHGSAPLLRHAYLLTGDLYRAQDLTQETLVRVGEAPRRVDMEMLPAYARRIMYNLNVSWWRHVTRREARLPDGADERAERATLMDQTLRLPTRTRTAIVLNYYEDRPAREIAEIVGCSEGAVHTLLSRGRAALPTSLQPAAHGSRWCPCSTTRSAPPSTPRTRPPRSRGWPAPGPTTVRSLYSGSFGPGFAVSPDGARVWL